VLFLAIWFSNFQFCCGSSGSSFIYSFSKLFLWH